MKQLSATERQEIKNLLEKKYENAITALDAADPGWRQRIEDRKNKLAIGKLRIEKEVIEKKKIEADILALQFKLNEVEQRISKKMSLHQRKVRYEDECPMPKGMCEAVGEIASEIHASVLAKDPTGKKLLVAEKELMDAMSRLATCDTRIEVITRKVL